MKLRIAYRTSSVLQGEEVLNKAATKWKATKIPARAGKWTKKEGGGGGGDSNRTKDTNMKVKTTIINTKDKTTTISTKAKIKMAGMMDPSRFLVEDLTDLTASSSLEAMAGQIKVDKMATMMVVTERYQVRSIKMTTIFTYRHHQSV